MSWRVALLPYLEQGDLYNKFKLDEPWDSPNNKPLLKEMPQVFLCPDLTKAEPFTTTYRGFSGSGSMFETDRSISFADVTDGTSNTIAVAESKDAVPWTKPDDLPFDPQAAPHSLALARRIRAGSTAGSPTARCDSSRIRLI